MIKIKIFCIIFMMLSGCSSANNHFSEANSFKPIKSGEYLNNDGFGNFINLIINEDGSYESKYKGIIGMSGSSNGLWFQEKNQVSFSPINESGALKGTLKPMTIVNNNRGLTLVPSKKIKLHKQLIVDYGKSTYSFQLNQI